MNRAALHRKAIESKYNAVCDIYEYAKVKDEVSRLTKSQEVLVKEKIPCHLSFSSVEKTAEGGLVVGKGQAVRLFFAPEVVIHAGSKLVVTQNGITQAYKNSSVPAVYASHQEIMLELFERWT